MVRRKSGGLRTVETTYLWLGDNRIVLSGFPGKRDWVANLAATPEVTLHTVGPGESLSVSGRARVVRNRSERGRYLIRYVERWTSQPGFPTLYKLALLTPVKLNQWLRLPWWMPFLVASRMFDRMPCVEITLEGTPTVNPNGPPGLSEFQDGNRRRKHDR